MFKLIKKHYPGASILSDNFGINKKTDWACTHCDFIGKNKGSLAGHMKKHNKEDDQVEQEINEPEPTKKGTVLDIN
jgi:hypothetical protein